MTEHIPLLSPKSFADFSPADFKTYVESLYVAPPVRPPPAEYSASLNKKGSLVVRITREPKYLTSAEVSQIASDLGFPLQELWLLLLKRKVEIRVPRRGK